MNLIRNMCLDVSLLKLPLHLRGTSELTVCVQVMLMVLYFWSLYMIIWFISGVMNVHSNVHCVQDNVLNTLRPRQDGRHFPDDILKCIFLNENVWTLITISLKFVLKGPNNNIPALVQIKAWRRPGDKPLSEPMMVRLPTHICVTRPQWVNNCIQSFNLWTSFWMFIYEYNYGWFINIWHFEYSLLSI